MLKFGILMLTFDAPKGHFFTKERTNYVVRYPQGIEKSERFVI
jgi:hypothetical protein